MWLITVVTADVVTKSAGPGALADRGPVQPVRSRGPARGVSSGPVAGLDRRNVCTWLNGLAKSTADRAQRLLHWTSRVRDISRCSELGAATAIEHKSLPASRNNSLIDSDMVAMNSAKALPSNP